MTNDYPYGKKYTPAPIKQRLMRFIEKRQDGCWQWTGSYRVKSGNLKYGQIAVSRSKAAGAHRVAYEVFVGPIPEGLVLDHLCRNTLCVNPEHLEPVTAAENVLRGDGYSARNKRKIHCPQGHAYNDENTRYAKSCGRTSRKCKTCERQRARDYSRRTYIPVAHRAQSIEQKGNP